MSKRFTDTLKWDDPFFLELSKTYKLLWIYILDKCDHAGIVKLNNKMMSFCLDTKINWLDVMKVFNGKIIHIENDKYFIPNFISFQYGDLIGDNRIHKSVIKILIKYKLWNEDDKCLNINTNIKQIHNIQDDNIKKDIHKDKIKHNEFVLLTIEEYDKLIDKLGKKNVDGMILKLNNYIGSHGKKYKSHYYVILNWAQKENLKKPQPSSADKYKEESIEYTDDKRKEVHELLRNTINEITKG